jgi:hypothetical protein
MPVDDEVPTEKRARVVEPDRVGFLYAWRSLDADRRASVVSAFDARDAARFFNCCSEIRKTKGEREYAAFWDRLCIDASCSQRGLDRFVGAKRAGSPLNGLRLYSGDWQVWQFLTPGAAFRPLIDALSVLDLRNVDIGPRFGTFDRIADMPNLRHLCAFTGSEVHGSVGSALANFARKKLPMLETFECDSISWEFFRRISDELELRKVKRLDLRSLDAPKCEALLYSDLCCPNIVRLHCPVYYNVHPPALFAFAPAVRRLTIAAGMAARLLIPPSVEDLTVYSPTLYCGSVMGPMVPMATFLPRLCRASFKRISISQEAWRLIDSPALKVLCVEECIFEPEHLIAFSKGSTGPGRLEKLTVACSENAKVQSAIQALIESERCSSLHSLDLRNYSATCELVRAPRSVVRLTLCMAASATSNDLGHAHLLSSLPALQVFRYSGFPIAVMPAEMAEFDVVAKIAVPHIVPPVFEFFGRCLELDLSLIPESTDDYSFLRCCRSLRKLSISFRNEAQKSFDQGKLAALVSAIPATVHELLIGPRPPQFAEVEWMFPPHLCHDREEAHTSMVIF